MSAVVDGLFAGNAADAELIRICAEHPLRIDAINEPGADCEDGNPLWVAYTESRDAISDAEPATMAGILAKCRAAKYEARGLAPEDDPEGSMAATWAWDIMNDLLFLYGDAEPHAMTNGASDT